MPDDQGKLTDQEKGVFEQWLKDHWAGGPGCPVCQQNQWILGDHLVVTTRIGKDGNINLGGVTYPQVLLVCGNCGNTLSFNARVMRLVEDDADTQSAKE